MKAGFLGRFQPFHLGHYKVIEERLNDFDNFVVIVGSAGKARSDENPLTFEERKSLIQACFPSLEIIPLEDKGKTEDGNRKWAENLEDIGIDAIISRNDLVKEIVKVHTTLKLVKQDLYEKNIYSGTEVRRRINSGEEWRYLTPKCTHKKLEELLDNIKKSGTQYEFEPGWKKDNAYHSTAEK